jgi:hypothetical protein
LLAVLGTDNEYDIHGHSPVSCAATALDDILGTHETRIRVDEGLYRMASRGPDLDRLRHFGRGTLSAVVEWPGRMTQLTCGRAAEPWTL